MGGWFRTARDQHRVRHSPASWEPRPGQYGLVSDDETLTEAADALRGRRVAVLTGAGVSTDSGLPDYRGRDAVPRSPMMVSEFLGSDLSRRRYWARSTVGWEWFRRALPHDPHRWVAELARRLDVTALITQNVDGLHQAAGSADVIELHGSLSRVVCQDCGHVMDRNAFQQDLLSLNPEIAERLPLLAQQAATAPDGDAEVDRTETFEYPDCPVCGGILKPDVVFFGENAHRDDVEAAFDALEGADALLVLGSSLSVMSGLRFARRAARDGKAVIIMGDGPTRGDDLATVRVHGRLADVLQRLVDLL